METIGEVDPHLRDFSTKWRSRIAVVMGGLVLAGGITHWQWDNLSASGEIYTSGPKHEQSSPQKDVASFVSWNLHNEAFARRHEIAELLQDHDGFAGQEVSTADAKKLQDFFPELYVTYVKADSKEKLLQGGFGNILITWQKPQDVESRPIAGSSFLESTVNFTSSVGADIYNVDPSLRRTGDFSDEDRALVGVTLDFKTGKTETKKLRLITGHLSPKESHQKKYFNWIDEQRKKTDGIVALADNNTTPETYFEYTDEYGLRTHLTGPTHTNGYEVLDYGSYSGDFLGYADVEVLPNATDHYALLYSFDISEEK